MAIVWGLHTGTNFFRQLLTSCIAISFILGVFSLQVTPESNRDLTADAGGPYVAYEGEPILFNASASQGPDGEILQYRWDFNGDGVWDTAFSDDPTAHHMWNDDYSGTAIVEVRTASGTNAIEIIGDLLPGGGFVIGQEKRAQSFLATFCKATNISLDVSLNRNEIPNAPLVLAIRSELNGSDLTAAEVEGVGMPVETENWVEFDFPDIAVVPGETYYVVLYSNATNRVPYQPHITYDAYPNGTAWAIAGGGVWSPSPTFDIRMMIFGDGEPTYALDEAPVTVCNHPPSISGLPSTIAVTEGHRVHLLATALDPGRDDLTFTWSWDLGPTETTIYDNDGSFPFTMSDTSDHVYGDDGTFVANLTVEDDDGGVVMRSIVVTVTNVAPSLSLTILPSENEGELLTFQVRATDPGSDDLTYSWWGHCNGWSVLPTLYPNDPLVVPDPYPSPEVYPRNVTDTPTVVCGDDGIFQWEVQVEDDDGGLTTMNGTFQVHNLPPSLTVSPPSFVQVDEGVGVTLGATSSDPGSDDLTFTWDWDYGPTETHIFFNSGVGPDPPDSPDGTFPFSVVDSSTHVYGDDCLCDVSLTVTDDDGGTLTYTTTVEVLNLPPVLVSSVEAYVTGNLTLRVAGEKWHDVTLRLYDGGVETAVVSVLRVPGSPDDQSVTIQDVVIDLFNGNLSALVEYTPLDDPVNGQMLGANPAWLIFTPCDGGEESRLHHTFNVKHPDTWVWSVEDFNALLVGVNITFEASAWDSGSDDSTFTWDWGDGTSTSTIYYNNGIGADSYPSPDVNPITVTDIQKHAFTARRGYVVTLTVEDDDGGVMLFSFDLSL